MQARSLGGKGRELSGARGRLGEGGGPRTLVDSGLEPNYSSSGHWSPSNDQYYGQTYIPFLLVKPRTASID